ncbi:related to Mig1 protein [Ustilago bromivora]|uniref:Related to Mig1 protein n=1 Tax=Ustilago bromivora TaxID=307758 RepID=A0A1K0G5G5_9BASI|nr:related to Mig1 protein [Ustilago bromivora]
MLALKSQLIGAALVLAFCAENLYSAHGYRRDDECPSYSKLLPRNTDYRKRCEAETGPDGADPKWPCFTFWNGDLNNVVADSSASGKAPDKFFLIKDGSKKDFTTVDPTKDFSVQWYQGDVQMSYSDFDKEKGCFKITLKHSSDDDLRIWVSAENSKERDIDTWKREETSKTLCTKWVHIHIKYDGQDW